MLTAKLAAPVMMYKALSCIAPQHDRIAPLILFSAPPGYLLTECLAETLHDAGYHTLWVRLEAQDCDPATFLLAMIHGAQQMQPDLGNRTLNRMRAQPGPVYGWPPLFACLAEEISYSLSTSAAIVIERFHHLYSQEQVLALFKSHFLPNLSPSVACILISHQRIEKADLPPHTRVIHATALRLEEQAGLALAEEYAPELSTVAIHRALHISDRSPGVLVSLLMANSILGPTRIGKTIGRANNTPQLLSILARDCLAADNALSPQILALALQMEYLHQDLTQSIWGEPVIPDGPWLQQLENQWVRIRSLWRSTLQAAVHVSLTTNQRVIQRSADYLLQSGLPQEAIALYFKLDDFPRAAAALAKVCENMMNLGQWERLARWTRRLPEDIRKDWPWLVYTLGEIEAAEGRLPEARRCFALAANWFSKQTEPRGACHSLLAESTLAAWQNDNERAKTSAQMAFQVAHEAVLPWLQGWAGWQLGWIASKEHRFQDAAAFFQHSTGSLNSTGFSSIAAEASSLAEHQLQLLQQREHYRQAMQEIEGQQRVTAAHLEQLLNTPPDSMAATLMEHGWSQIPLMGKLIPDLTSLEPSPENHLRKVRETVRRAWLAWRRVLIQPATPVPPVEALHRLPAPDLIVKAPASPDRPDERFLPAPSPEPAPLSNPAIYCLGPFRFFYHNQSVENWGSKKGQQIFKYLVTHRQYPTQKEVLMDTFWPDADPEAARRNLHQAVYTLRQALKAELDLHCICFENDCYFVQLEQTPWIDHDEFEQHAKAGQQLEQTGQAEQAMLEYSLAEGLYQDDFLVEDLYEDWPKSRREFLWQLYLLITQRLCEHYLERAEYAAAMSLSRRILARDQAQEPAHQILIRAYLGQGLRHMALRQYKNCVQILKQELSLPPAPKTQALYQQILKTE